MTTTTTGKATEFITFSRASGATVVASDGKIKWAGHNLVLNSATPVTQTLTVVVGFAYTVECTGTGSVALTGAGTGTVSAGSPVTVTASTTSLVLTITGTVATMWAYRSGLGGMVPNPSTGTSYYPTTGSVYNAPRLDYDPVTLAAKGLLVEEQRANALTYSEQFDNVAWTKTRISISANAIAAPSGAVTAEKLVEDTTPTSTHFTLQSANFTASAAYTLTVYAKMAERSVIVLQYGAPAFGVAISAWFNLATGVVSQTINSPSSTSIQNIGNGWYRCSMTATATVTAGANCNIYLDTSPIGTAVYTGDGVSGAYIYGAQLEAGSFATSYIPTTSASATRSADAASVATSAFPYNASEGTIVAAFDTVAGVSTVFKDIAVLSDGTSSNRIRLYVNTASTSLFLVSTGGVTQANVSTSAVSVGTPAKFAGAYKTDDFAATLNGAAVVDDTVGSVPSGITSLDIGGAASLNGHIRQITYIPRRLTNAELQARTQ